MHSASAEGNSSYALLHIIGRDGILASRLALNGVAVVGKGEAAFAKHCKLSRHRGSWQAEPESRTGHMAITCSAVSSRSCS